MSEAALREEDATAPATQRDEIETGGRGLRAHAARGTLVNSAFQIGLAGLGLLRRLVIAAFLTRSEFGVWGIIVTTLLTLSWLKQLGISDKYVQQNEPDQELAFQKAFSLELLVSLAFFVVLVAVLPVYGVAYGHPEIIVPGIIVAASVPISAFESPIWVPYRRMQFVRQRTLSAVDDVTAFVVTVIFGVLGFGYWCLVIGTVAGSVAGAIAACATCPYKIRFRFHRDTLRQYATFSWPLFALAVTNLISVQSIMLVSAHAVGIAAVGSIALASSLSAFADRVDDIVSHTIYPAVCAVRDRIDLMYEAFVTSNRLAVMWGTTFGVAVALFARDIVHYLFGDKWLPAVGLISAFGVIAAMRQVGFNWQIFMRAVGTTRPMFVAALTNLAAIGVFMIPATIAWGTTGYAVGMGVAVIVQIAQREFYLSRLFPQHRPLPHVLRALLPSIPPTLLILGLRLAVGMGDRSMVRVAAELLLYAAATLASTWIFERKLVRELIGYLRGGGGVRSRREMTSPAGP